MDINETHFKKQNDEVFYLLQQQMRDKSFWRIFFLTTLNDNEYLAYFLHWFQTAPCMASHKSYDLFYSCLELRRN